MTKVLIKNLKKILCQLIQSMKISNLEYKDFQTMSLKKFGIIGQKKIKSSKVLVLGMGGLGCPLSVASQFRCGNNWYC